MTLILTGAPIGEPVTLLAFKDHLRIDTGDEDDLLVSLLAAAREHLEALTGLALLPQTWRLALDEWPDGGVIHLLKSPVQAVDAVTVYDADGMPASIDPGGMLLDGHARPARLWLKDRPRPGQCLNGIEIDFSAGFPSAAEVPEELKRAILLHAAFLHEFRGVLGPDEQPAGEPAGYRALISPWLRRAL